MCHDREGAHTDLHSTLVKYHQLYPGNHQVVFVVCVCKCGWNYLHISVKSVISDLLFPHLLRKTCTCFLTSNVWRNSTPCSFSFLFLFLKCLQLHTWLSAWFIYEKCTKKLQVYYPGVAQTRISFVGYLCFCESIGEQKPCSCVTVICQEKNPLCNFMPHDIKGADMHQLACECTRKCYHALCCTVTQKSDCNISNFNWNSPMFRMNCIACLLIYLFRG